MANGFNKWIGVGNLGKDPEVKYAKGAGGGAYCDLRIACNERRKDGDSGWKDHVEWVTVRVVGKTAENCGQYLAKGRQVHVEGKLETVTWKDQKTGEDKYMTRVFAHNVMFLGGDKGGGGGGAPRGGQRQQSAPAGDDGGFNDAVDGDGGGGFIDDDLPF